MLSSIESSWQDSDESILLIVFHDGWTAHNFSQMIHQISPLMTARPHRVHVFIDFQDNFAVPPLVIGIINNAKQHFSDNVGLVVVITPSLIIKHIYETIKPILALDYVIVFADDLEDAHRQLDDYQKQTGHR